MQPLNKIHTVIGVRANIHLGGQTEFCPNGFGGGGGVVAEFFFRDPYSVGEGVVAKIFRDPYSVGCQNLFPLTLVTYPKFVFFFPLTAVTPVFQTCIVFCPNNVASLPEFMSTNCPNWGGGNCPPVPYAYACSCIKKRVFHSA